MILYMTLCERGEEEKAQEKKKGDGRRETKGGKEKLKGFFYLLLNQLSTMQEIIKGDKKTGEMGLWRPRRAEKEGGRQGGRKKERRRVNITALCQANMRCWDTSTKSHRSYRREREKKRDQETEGGRERERGCKRDTTSRDREGNAGKWKVKASSSR